MPGRTQRIGIILNGATGELVGRQHLPALAALRDEGGLPLPNGDRLVPDAILVGRDPVRLAAAAARSGFARWTTDLPAALRAPDDAVFFDAAPSGQRFERVRQAIAAGKHVYAEKPVAGTLDQALALCRLARAAGIRHGTVQDKLFLPGFAALRRLRQEGFFGRILEVRLEMGRWIFDGFDRPGQRPSWNYRRQDGGGLILDMFPHWRYMLDGLAGEVRAVSATCRTQVPQRRDERGAAFAVDVDDSVFAQFEMEGGAIAAVNSSWCTRARREFAIQVQIDGTEGSAVAGPFGCWRQADAQAPGGAISAALPQAGSLFDNWTPVPVDAAATNSYRAGWELFLRHAAANDPAYPFPLEQGAKGVQLAELAYQSSRERRWIEVPALPV